MHDVLRERLLRRIESLPEDRIYQVLDYIEFLESKYAPDASVEASGLQRFAERMEDRLRRRAVSPATLREAFQLISAADRVLHNVSNAGRQIFGELGDLGGPEAGSARESRDDPAGASVPPVSPGREGRGADGTGSVADRPPRVSDGRSDAPESTPGGTGDAASP